MHVSIRVNHGKADGNLAAMSRHWVSLVLAGDLVQFEPRLFLDPELPLPNFQF